MKFYIRIAVAALVVAGLSACATVTRGTKQKFEITSEPSGAQVDLTIGQKCVTPCKLKLKRREAFTATFTKEGYEIQQANVKSQFSGGGAAAGAGNILLGGFIGAGVDASNGALNNLNPNPLNVILKPIAPAPAAAVVASAPVASEAASMAATAPAEVSAAPAVEAGPVAETASSTPATAQ